ncbi:MAG: hypothetical protein KGH98_00560 [Candidatus Micrarchaeota archaeon]|nr:hypothetical protein [Candidatus Micrarchaeota archaeon]
MRKNLRANAIYAVLILGVIVSVYLTIVHFEPTALVCPNTGPIDCEQVLTSSYSVVLRVPLAVWSLIWFAAWIALFRLGVRGIVADVWGLLGVGGLIYSITAMDAIGKICIYCSSLDVLIVLLLLFRFAVKE